MNTTYIKPAWLVEAEKYIGVKEVKGPMHEELILKWWRDIKRGGIKDDETPWCAAFVGACLEAVGIQSTRFESAKSYLQWGVELPNYELGCIVVFSRVGGGHVGFLAGRDKSGHIMVLGGNQSDAVNVRAFDLARAVGFRWPDNVPLPTPAPLPLLAGSLSIKEA